MHDSINVLHDSINVLHDNIHMIIVCQKESLGIYIVQHITYATKNDTYSKVVFV